MVTHRQHHEEQRHEGQRQNRRRGGLSCAARTLGAVGLVLAPLFANAAHAQDHPAEQIYAYASGTEWVVNASGTLIAKTRVLMQVELDERSRVVRETVTPSRAGYGGTDERQLLLTITDLRRTQADTTWVASDEKDGIRRATTTVLSSERLWSYEVWTDRAGKVVLYRVRDGALISKQRFDGAARRRQQAVDRMSR